MSDQRLFEVVQSDDENEFVSSSSSEVEEESNTPPPTLFDNSPRKKRKRQPPQQYLFESSEEEQPTHPEKQEEEKTSERITASDLAKGKRKRARKKQKTRQEVPQHVPPLPQETGQEEAPQELDLDGQEEFAEMGFRDETWGVEKNPDERDEEHECHFKPVILPSRRRLEALLMPGEDPNGPCFACTYQENSHVGVIGKHWNTMTKMLHESLTTRPPEVAFYYVHQFFVENVMTPFIKNNCHDDQMREQFEQTPIEYVWSPYKVAQHYTQHTIDPLLTTVFDMWDLKAVKELIKSDMLAKQHDQSGRVIVDPKALDMLFKVQREEKALYMRNPEKMLAANTDARLPEKYAHIHHNRVAVIPFRSKRPYPDQFTITPK